MASHSNLFGYYDDFHEVYRKLLEDEKRDIKQLKIYGFAGAALFCIAMNIATYSSFLYFLSACSIVQMMIIFIDMSNRNSMMHIMDYLEWKDRNKNL